MSESKKPNLMARPLIDLREMLARENKLLANRRFVERLKDKGEKIRRFRDEIERAIKIKQSMEETESFLARLSLGEKAILPQHPMVRAFDFGFEVFEPIPNCVLCLSCAVLGLDRSTRSEAGGGQTVDEQRRAAEEQGGGKRTAERRIRHLLGSA